MTPKRQRGTNLFRFLVTTTPCSYHSNSDVCHSLRLKELLTVLVCCEHDQVDQQPKDDGTVKKKLEDLRKEVDHLKRSLAREVSRMKRLSICVISAENKYAVRQNHWHDF